MDTKAIARFRKQNPKYADIVEFPASRIWKMILAARGHKPIPALSTPFTPVTATGLIARGIREHGIHYQTLADAEAEDRREGADRKVIKDSGYEDPFGGSDLGNQCFFRSK